MTRPTPSSPERRHQTQPQQQEDTHSKPSHHRRSKSGPRDDAHQKKRPSPLTRRTTPTHLRTLRPTTTTTTSTTPEPTDAESFPSFWYVLCPLSFLFHSISPSQKTNTIQHDLRDPTPLLHHRLLLRGLPRPRPLALLPLLVLPGIQIHLPFLLTLQIPLLLLHHVILILPTAIPANIHAPRYRPALRAYVVQGRRLLAAAVPGEGGVCKTPAEEGGE
jgi:hypothetical protein